MSVNFITYEILGEEFLPSQDMLNCNIPDPSQIDVWNIKIK